MASQDEHAQDYSFPAAGDLSSDQFKFVIMDSAGRVAVVTGASTQKAIGVLQNKPAAIDRPAQVRVSGMTKVIAGETIDEGEQVTCSEVVAGKADDADTATDVILGLCVQGGAVDEKIKVLLFGGPSGEVS